MLEVGTGSGYQTAVLARLAHRVCSIERIEALARQARVTLESIGIRNVDIKVGDGSLGWRARAPFEAIVVTAGSPLVPDPLVEQLSPGGRLVIPVGDRSCQSLLRIRRSMDGGTTREELVECRFVDLQGAFGWHD